MESDFQRNGKVPIPQARHGIASHRQYPAPSSSPVNARSGADRAKSWFQAETIHTNGYSTPDGSPCHMPQAVPSYDAPCSYRDFDPTKSPPQINTILQDTSSHVSSTRPDHGEIPVSTESVASASSESSEPTQKSPVSASSELVDDDPIYNVGQLKIFDQKQKAIPKLYEARWQVIRPDIFDRVETKLRSRRFAVRLNKNKNRAPAIIELMSAGIDKERSIPAVVVIIPKHIKTMQNFLDTNSTIQSRCRPEDGTTVELLVLACKGSSTLIGKSSQYLLDDVVCSSDSDDSTEFLDDDSSLNSLDDSDNNGELHATTGVLEVDAHSISVVREGSNIDEQRSFGMGIRLITKDGSRFVRGTCGGLLQIHYHGQPPKQVGLIAGHLLEQLGQASGESHQGKVDVPCSIGDIFYPKTSTKIPRHDWALFEASKLDLSYDMARQHNISVAQCSEIPEANTVVVIRTTRGEMTGTLSSSDSGIMLRPNQGFVHVRTIMMHEGSIITKGDSGAWVYHLEFGKTYGYVIAANGNGHTYMVPLHAAITEMRLALDAVSISLAVPIDRNSRVRLSRAHRQSEQASNTDQDPGMTSQLDVSTIRNEIHRLKARVGTFLDDGQAAKAIMWLQTGVAIQERLPQEDQSRLAWQHKLGKAYLELGLVPAAITILKEIVMVRGEVLEADHADSLAAQHELAVAYIQNGQASEAIRLLENVVATEAEILDESNIGRLTSQHELARAYLADGQALEAINILHHVVAVKAKILDKSDPHLLASQIVLAEAGLRFGGYPNTIKLLEHVVSVATGTSSEHKKIRFNSQGWLNLARGLPPQAHSRSVAGQESKLSSVFLEPRKQD